MRSVGNSAECAWSSLRVVRSNRCPARLPRCNRVTQTATAPIFGMILVPDRLDMAHAITAGRAWQRLHLAAMGQGLAAQPLNQPVEMIDRNQMLGRQDEFGPGLATLSREGSWDPRLCSGSATRSAKHRTRHVGRLKTSSPQRPRSPTDRCSRRLRLPALRS
jgi:hypothetical protein